MPLLLAYNNAATNLAGAISNVATTAQLTAGAGALFSPAPLNGQYFVAALNDAATGLLYEYVHVTGVVGDIVTMVRGQEGTEALNWLAGDFFVNDVTAGSVAIDQQVLVTAGNPNGSLAGVAATGGLGPTAAWDTVNLILWYCIATGGPGSAVWVTASAATAVTGQCQLNYVSGTMITLSTFGGGASLRLNGGVMQVPTSGLNSGLTGVYLNGVAGQNLVANTNYDVFVFSFSGALTYDFWNSGGHLRDTTAGNVGVEVRNNSGLPDSTRSYIGKVRISAGTAFQPQGIGVISWFNQRSLPLMGTATGNINVSSTSVVELSTASRVNFLTFGAGLIASVGGSAGNNVQGNSFGLAVGWDGVESATNVSGEGYSDIAGATTGLSGFASDVLAEGAHYVTPLGNTSGNTATFNGATVLITVYG